jgi:hypothetical protein
VHVPRTTTAALAALSITAVTLTAVPALAGAPGSTRSSTSTTSRAGRAGALATTWLANHVSTSGAVKAPDRSVDLGATANTVLALAASDRGRVQAERATAFLRKRVDTYVKDSLGVDRPGQLATLILVADAMGIDPNHFGGGRSLITRLRATQHRTGADAGLFGSQDPTFDGAFRQGLALLALAAVDRRDALGIGWLRAQRCADGGWSAYRSAGTPCSAEDTNSTALAVQGLRAERVKVAGAAAWLASAQQASGGWTYYDDPTDDPADPFDGADPNSTAVVIQALLALGQDPGHGAYARSGGTAFTALASFQIKACTSKDRGALSFTRGGPANGLATQQAVPALVGRTFPLGPVTWSGLRLVSTRCPA